MRILSVQILNSATLIMTLAFSLCSINIYGSPKIEFKKLDHNFGDVFSGQNLEHSFEFSNTGTAPLHILGVNTACGCTLVDAPLGEPIAPGKSSFIKIRFDTSKLAGYTSKSIVVMTNQQHQNSNILTFTANVKEIYIVKPPVVSFGQISYTQSPEQSVIIQSKDNSKISPGKIQYNKNTLKVEENTSPDRPYQLLISLKKPYKLGFFKENISIETNNKLVPKVVIPVTATINGPIQIEQRLVELGTVNQNKSAQKKLLLTSSEPFKLTGQQISIYMNGSKVSQGQLIDAKFYAKDAEEKSWMLELNVPAQKNISGSLNGQIVLNTNLAVQDKIAIDFHALFM